MIVEKVDEAKQRKIKQWPVQSNRASAVGFPCERKLVYDRTNWQDKVLHDVGLQYIFDEGNRQEQVTIQDLQEAGFHIIEGQRPFQDKDLQLTGHIDFRLQIDGKVYPVEVKGLSPFTWDKIDTFQDFLKSNKVFIRGYASQMTLYLYLADDEEGIMLLRNKLTGRYKEISVKLDWDLADNLVKKLQRINKHIKEETLPDRMPFDSDICLKECPYRHICTPEANNPSRVAVEDDEELEAMLSRRAELEPLSKEYVKLDASIKEIGKQMDRENLIIGDWIISRKPYTINRKPSPGGEYKGIKVSIQRLGGENDKG